MYAHAHTQTHTHSYLFLYNYGNLSSVSTLSNIWRCSCWRLLSILTEKADWWWFLFFSPRTVAWEWGSCFLLFTTLFLLFFFSPQWCGALPVGPWTPGTAFRQAVEQTPKHSGYSHSSVSFPTCCSALPESALSIGIALILSLLQRNNTHSLISVWWMKSFNETGPNCSGKLPYFGVLNGSDPSAAARTLSPLNPSLMSGPCGPSAQRSLQFLHHCSGPLCLARGLLLIHCPLSLCAALLLMHGLNGHIACSVQRPPTPLSLGPGSWHADWWNAWRVLITLAGCSFISVAYLRWAR